MRVKQNLIISLPNKFEHSTYYSGAVNGLMIAFRERVMALSVRESVSIEPTRGAQPARGLAARCAATYCQLYLHYLLHHTRVFIGF